MKALYSTLLLILCLCTSCEGTELNNLLHAINWRTTLSRLLMTLFILTIVFFYVTNLLRRLRQKNVRRMLKMENEMNDVIQRITELKIMQQENARNETAWVELDEAISVLKQERDNYQKEMGEGKLYIDLGQKKFQTPEVNWMIQNNNEIRALKEQHRQLITYLINTSPIVNRLRSHPSFLEEKEWKELTALLNATANNFGQRLHDTYPQLTENDIHLAMLLKLRFNNQQIATLMAISASSVAQNKTRLKNKLTQSNNALFANKQPLDMYFWEF